MRYSGPRITPLPKRQESAKMAVYPPPWGGAFSSIPIIPRQSNLSKNFFIFAFSRLAGILWHEDQRA